MTIVSEIWTWHENDRLLSRFTTNVPRKTFLAKMALFGLLELAEAIQAFFDDRVNGGNGYEILWKDGIDLNDLENLARL